MQGPPQRPGAARDGGAGGAGGAPPSAAGAACGGAPGRAALQGHAWAPGPRQRVRAPRPLQNSTAALLSAWCCCTCQLREARSLAAGLSPGGVWWGRVLLRCRPLHLERCCCPEQWMAFGNSLTKVLSAAHSDFSALQPCMCAHEGSFALFTCSLLWWDRGCLKGLTCKATRMQGGAACQAGGGAPGEPGARERDARAAAGAAAPGHPGRGGAAHAHAAASAHRRRAPHAACVPPAWSQRAQYVSAEAGARTAWVS